MRRSRRSGSTLFVFVALLGIGLLGGAATVARSESEQELPEYISPNVYSPPAAVDAMLRIADLHDGDVVYDLGSGDGRIVIAAAQRPGVRAVGIDIDPKEIAKARAGAERAGVADRVEFIEQDFLRADFSKASVVTLYHFPSVFKRLRPVLKRQFQLSTRVVTLDFPIEGWRVSESTKLRDDYGIERTIYAYVLGRHTGEEEGAGSRR